MGGVGKKKNGGAVNIGVIYLIYSVNATMYKTKWKDTPAE
jgi:hypothetical protein